jgi:hypothetical protein
MSCPQLFLDLEKLYSDCYDRVKNFPKLDKYLLGKDILNFLNEAHKYALLSIYNQSYLFGCSANFDLFKKSLRIAVDKKFISYKWYGSQLEPINVIGKEIGGWLNKSKTSSF